MRNLQFKRPDPSECEALSRLIYESKASHGYSETFMTACRDELLVTRETLLKGPCYSAWDDQTLSPRGFVQLVRTGDNACELQALFISPVAQGLGLGRKLFQWAVQEAHKKRFSEMTINADPGAEGFYTNLGASKIGQQPSGSIPGRYLPRLMYKIL